MIILYLGISLMISILLERFSKFLDFSLSSVWPQCWPIGGSALFSPEVKPALSCLLLFYWGSCAMTGKGLLACIDLAWIGLALAGLVWFEAQPGIGGQVWAAVKLRPGLAWPGVRAASGFTLLTPHSSVSSGYKYFLSGFFFLMKKIFHFLKKD